MTGGRWLKAQLLNEADLGWNLGLPFVNSVVLSKFLYILETSILLTKLEAIKDLPGRAAVRIK